MPSHSSEPMESLFPRTTMRSAFVRHPWSHRARSPRPKTASSSSTQILQSPLLRSPASTPRASLQRPTSASSSSTQILQAPLRCSPASTPRTSLQRPTSASSSSTPRLYTALSRRHLRDHQWPSLPPRSLLHQFVPPVPSRRKKCQVHWTLQRWIPRRRSPTELSPFASRQLVTGS